MKKLSAGIAAFLAVALAACGGSSAHAISKDMISNLESINATFDTIKDEASAKAAADKLAPLAAKMSELQDQMSKLKPTEAEMAEMGKDLMPRLTELQQKFGANMMRIGSDPKLAAALEEVFKKLDAAKTGK
jgi:hypothetical protein